MKTIRARFGVSRSSIFVKSSWRSPTAIESEKCDRNVSRHTYACFERRQLVPLVRHGDGIIL